MTNFHDYANQNKTVQELRSHNLKWLHIPGHSCQILIIRGSVSGKTNAFLNLINNQPDIDKINLTLKIHMKLNTNF